uniref:Chlororespiratory reduction 3 n=1 Tax=Cypripedium formosanum TaxID=53042 RepID=A0A0F7GZQ3_9ASPA
MGWVLAAGFLPTFPLRPHHSAAHKGGGRCRTGAATSALASPSDDANSHDKVDASSRRRRPTSAEIRRAIGVDELPRVNGGSPSSPSSSSSSSPFMDFLATTPIGQSESAAERTVREFAEWFVVRTEAKVVDGARMLMVLCLSILPLWILLFLVASGIIKLPFSLPMVEDLIM